MVRDLSEREKMFERPKQFVWGEILRRNASMYPNRVAQVYEDKRQTYRELNSRVNRLSNGLISLGFKKGDAASILLYNCSEFMEAAFAIFKAGGCHTPINYRAVGQEIEYLVNHNDVSLLFIGSALLGSIKNVQHNFKNVRNIIVIGDDVPKGMIGFEELFKLGTENEPEVDVWEGDPCILMATSGTTGRQKTAIHTHRTIVGIYAGQVPMYHNHRDGDRGLVCLPLYSAGGLGFDAGSTMLRAGSLYIIPFIPFNPELVLQTIDKEKINHTTMAPVMLNAILALPKEVRSKYDVSSLYCLCSAGAPTEPATREKAVKYFGEILYVNYAAAELGLVTVLNPQGILKYPTSSGQPAIPMEVKIIDDKGNDLPPGEIGEIAIASELSCLGYNKDPEATKELFRGKFVCLGDMGYIDNEGYLYVVDRKKDMIISGGANIYSAEVEFVLRENPKIAAVAVIGVPDEKWGEAVKAFIILRPNQEATEEEIINWSRDKIAGYKIPKSVDFVSELPMTATGKVRKNILREKYWDGYSRKVKG